LFAEGKKREKFLVKPALRFTESVDDQRKGVARRMYLCCEQQIVKDIFVLLVVPLHLPQPILLSLKSLNGRLGISEIAEGALLLLLVGHP